jgi:hypothetical protein
MSDYYSSEDSRILLALAHRSIAHGLQRGRPLPIDPAEFSDRLQQPGASFVTLKLDGALRGCIGSLEPHQPLVSDVAHNAHAAAFSDPRFHPLQQGELDRLDISISILTPAEEMTFGSEQELLQMLRPGVDGLILSEGGRRGTFLPAVWEQLPDPREFLRHLKIKAGLPAGYWSDSLRISRYTAQSLCADS